MCAAEAALRALATFLPELTAPAALELGPLRVHSFGVLVAAGLVAFHLGFVRRAGLPRGRADAIAIATTGAGLLGVLVLLPALGGAEVSAATAITSATLSTLGAAPFAALGLTAACLATRTPIRRAFDDAALAFAPAMLLARSGCALVHDHLGRETSSALGVAFAAGRRFDLGVLEWLGLAPLVALILVRAYLPTSTPGRAPGHTAVAIASYYGALRVALALLAS